MRRTRDLARMRFIATGLLGLMAVIFVAAIHYEPRWPWLAAVRAFAEAGMVGACADWFAVTALFRRPLGLPIPHTGIIPRNKDRIGEALGSFIAQNFLTAEVLTAKLQQLELAHWGGEWLADPDRAKALAGRLARALPQMLDQLPPNLLRNLVASLARSTANAVPAAPALANLLAAAWHDGRSQDALDWLVEKLAAYLAEQDEVVEGHVSAQSARWMPKFVDRYIAGKITDGVQDLLHQMRSPDHPWRLEIRTMVEGFIDRLRSDPNLAAHAETIKRAVLQDERVLGFAETVWTDLETRLRDNRDTLAEPLAQMLMSLGAWLQHNDAARSELNAWARTMARRVIAPRRHEIGRFVAQVVAGWDSKSVVDKLELQFGPDLQYIRINGTLVGGLVGLLIYAFTRLAGV